jgi:hypothetical protein
MSAMQRGQLVAWASPALRPEPRPCWPSKPAATWLLVADLLSTWPTGLESASKASSLPSPLLASGWRVNHLASLLTSSPSSARSSPIYKELTCTFPTPLVERVRGDLPWHNIWPRLQGPSLEAVEVNLHFSLLHGLLDVQANRHHWRVAPSPACPTCQPQAASETILHSSPTVPGPLQPGTSLFLFSATITLGVALTDEVLLYLAWPPSAARADAAVVLAVTTFTALAWASRSSSEFLAPTCSRQESCQVKEKTIYI